MLEKAKEAGLLALDARHLAELEEGHLDDVVMLAKLTAELFEDLLLGLFALFVIEWEAMDVKQFPAQCGEI